MNQDEGDRFEPTGLGPLGDIQVLAAMLRADRDDVESYARVLTGALGDALPPGMVDISYQRSLGDRLAGRPARPVRLAVQAGEKILELSDGRAGVQAMVRTVVRGVVISRKEVGIDEWVVLLAKELSDRAAQSAAARQALQRLFGR